jgi:hypothetical protein
MLNDDPQRGVFVQRCPLSDQLQGWGANAAAADGNKPPDNLPPDIRPISYDVELSFIDYPKKTLLNAGTVLVRLDFPVSFAVFMSVWWMRKEVLETILHSADPDSAALRREWQHASALPKAAKGTRTRIVEIVLTEPVYALGRERQPAVQQTRRSRTDLPSKSRKRRWAEPRLNVGEAASGAANSALKAASEISTAAREQVHGAVTGTIAGVKVVLGDEEARSRDEGRSKPAHKPRRVQKSGHGRSTGKAAP